MSYSLILLPDVAARCILIREISNGGPVGGLAAHVHLTKAALFAHNPTPLELYPSSQIADRIVAPFGLIAPMVVDSVDTTRSNSREASGSEKGNILSLLRFPMPGG